MSAREIEIAHLRDSAGRPQFAAVRSGHELEIDIRKEGERVFRALGSYAVYQPDGQPWQLISADHYENLENFHNVSPWCWASPEVMRTSAGEGRFLYEHMDLIEEELVDDQRVTNAANRLSVTSPEALHRILFEHGINMQTWDMESRQDLYDNIRPTDQDKSENVVLHSVEGELWLATTETMLNVYYIAEDGIKVLRETQKTHYDRAGNPSQPIKSTIRSSMGETGHIIAGRPERPGDTARRGLREELGVTEESIVLIHAIDSLLRLKRRHHRYPIRARHKTHYFTVVLKAANVLSKYVNEEKDTQGRLRTRIESSWTPHNKNKLIPLVPALP